MTPDTRRSLEAVLEDAREAHRAALILADVPLTGHVAVLTEAEADVPGPDAECHRCGHINEADYAMAGGYESAAGRWTLDHGALIFDGTPLLTLVRAQWGDDAPPAARLDALSTRIVDMLNAEGIEA